MGGIYFHIPYCKQACHYCDFHFSTVLSTRDDLLKAMRAELSSRRNARMEGQLQSIYFGGGTPSILTVDELKSLLDDTRQHFSVAEDAEFTLEANPDDLHDADKLREWRDMGINRLSIGLQSFHDADLQWMNRAHNRNEALTAVQRAQDAGFEALTVDLIYGLPNWTGGEWEHNLAELEKLNVPHFSAYILTVEDKTALGHQVKTGKQRMTDDSAIEQQYALLCDWAKTQGYDHYEVSNFAREGKRAVHNSAYWTGAPYLGIGPGAHSYAEAQRRWNVASNTRYIRAFQREESYFETEELTLKDRYNEYLMTGLRTARGISLEEAEQRYGLRPDRAEPAAWQALLSAGHLIQLNDHYRIPEPRWLLGDGISSELFAV
jgi:oxygen-independent coproporphyrinogen-3 oxidase